MLIPRSNVEEGFLVIIFAIITIKINHNKPFNRPMFLYNLSWKFTLKNHFL